MIWKSCPNRLEVIFQLEYVLMNISDWSNEKPLANKTICFSDTNNKERMLSQTNVCMIVWYFSATSFLLLSWYFGTCYQSFMVGSWLATSG